jgi:hypothetical protein
MFISASLAATFSTCLGSALPATRGQFRHSSALVYLDLFFILFLGGLLLLYTLLCGLGLEEGEEELSRARTGLRR